MLAVAANFSDPLFWAAFIGWVLSVVLHEFAHGLVAWLGGDYTIRERGGLSLNPLQYVDPVMSLILPIVFMLMGGIPLPGGVTYVHTELLRGKGWSSAVSAAGPAMNFLLFLLLALALNPHLGWVHRHQSVLDWTSAQRLVGALAFLELFSVLLNLIPVPPLDGFGIISPYLAPEIQAKVSRGPAATGLFFLVFLLISGAGFQKLALPILEPVIHKVGLRYNDLAGAFNLVFFGRAYVD